MKIISWNTNGLRATATQGFWDPLFVKYKPDIVCLQETKAEPEQLSEEVRNRKGYYSYFAWSKTKKGYSGVAIYSKVPAEKVTELGIKKFDDQGRTLVAYFNSPAGEFVLINCYFPNGGGGPEKLEYKLEFYDAFLSFVNDLRKQKKKVIFCGDVNVAHTEIDLARPKENVDHVGFLPVERAWMDEVIDAGWIDVYRHFYPKKVDAYTYWDTYTRARERNVGWRIDYFFASPDLMNRISKTQILADYYGSDHCPIMLEFKD